MDGRPPELAAACRSTETAVATIGNLFSVIDLVPISGRRAAPGPPPTRHRNTEDRVVPDLGRRIDEAIAFSRSKLMWLYLSAIIRSQHLAASSGDHGD